MAMLSSFCLAFSCLSIATAAPVSNIPLLPSQDPWYTAPKNWQNTAPGTILRYRVAPGNLSVSYNASTAHNILYRTTDSRYQPSWAVTTLFAPHEASGSKLLSYQIPYNSPNIDAGPSYSLYAPETLTTALVYHDIQAALELGWHVNVPDFEAHTASFTLGITEGHAVLDSVRAALTSAHGCEAESSRCALWGYSGGSIASEWAAELQAHYAPELRFAGAALGGVVANVSASLTLASGQWWTGLLPAAVFGITNESPEARAYIISQLKTSGPYNASGFLPAASMTIEEAFEVYAEQPIFEYFVNGLASLQAPVFQQIVEDNGIMGYHGIPEMPLYMYKAIQDEIAPIGTVDQLVKKYCKIGVNIDYERNSIGGHLAEETNGDYGALQWLAQVLEGEYSHSGCTIQNVAVNVTDSPM